MAQHGANELLAGAARTEAFDQRRQHPTDDHQPDGDQARDVAVERPVAGERKVRAGKPDEECDQQKADQQYERAALEESEHSSFNRKKLSSNDEAEIRSRYVPRTWTISTRRFRARFSGSDSGR